MSTKQKKADSAAPKAEPSAVVEKAVSLRDYFVEARIEIKKVTWPDRKEIKVTTIAVLVLVVVMSIFLGLVDFGLSSLMQFILSYGA